MAQRLSAMDIKQVHLVGSPAIKKRYLICKSSEEKMTEQEEKEAQAKAEEAKAEEARKSAEADALAKAEQEIKSAQDKAEAAIKARDAALIKSALEILKSVETEEAKSAVDALEGLSERKVEKSNKMTEKEVSDILKSQLPDFTKAVTEPITKALDETKKELEEVRKSYSELINEKNEREISELAEKLSGDKKENVEYVRMMKKSLSPSDFETFINREVAKSEQLRKSTFKELGTSRGAPPSSDDPYTELKTLSEEISKSENCSANDAFAKAVLQRPDLYDAYRTASYSNKSRED